MTIVQNGELSPLMVRRICNQPKIDPNRLQDGSTRFWPAVQDRRRGGRAMEQEWVYGYALREEEGEIHAYASAAPEAIVSGATREEAAQAMRDALTAAVRGRIKLGLDLVPPAAPDADEREVFILPAALAAKATLYTAWKASGLSKVALGARIGCAEKEVRRILDPDYPTGLARREQVARALGVELVVGARPAAAVAA
ncbi:hypothetical protein [Methylobacterium isbiliense]|nr:hypothetical protein [Methylobacterium isbiliense]MDN3622450.1 hypothetical protein [Methylobacterium isbiliense]